MKTKIMLLIIGIIIPIMSNAEKSYAGIFLTAKDFRANSITIIADSAQCNAIKIDDFFFRPYVWIKTSNAKLKIPKDSVFAIKMPDMKVYRIIKNENYLLLDTSNICIYSQEKPISIPKKTIHSTRYEYQKRDEFYFSKTITDSIMELNRINIRLTLLKDKQFDNELVSHFITDESLSVKDENGQFNLNIFLNSINY